MNSAAPCASAASQPRAAWLCVERGLGVKDLEDSGALTLRPGCRVGIGEADERAAVVGDGIIRHGEAEAQMLNDVDATEQTRLFA
ncbi:MAG TPA: hypothetical protein VFD27_10425 [Chthoniobacteraceae bacterium]|nr:hypothetical protein [Chthoniobacteraceae bacterium]